MGCERDELTAAQSDVSVCVVGTYVRPGSDARWRSMHEMHVRRRIDAVHPVMATIAVGPVYLVLAWYRRHHYGCKIQPF
jgi:hypothetical protein